MREFTNTREIVERIKDIISKEIDGFVYDYHVAKALNITPNSLRIALKRNKLPDLKQIAIFCYKKNVNINDLIF